MKVTVIGSGYVGLVSGAGFAETGANVVCADIDAGKVERLDRGELDIFEPRLDELVARNVEAGRLSFTSEVAEAIARAEVIFVAVGTPSRSDGGANLQAVDTVAEDVARHAGRECCLVLKSTVPVGTNARVRRIVADAEHRIHVVSNPEFLKEGDAVNDFLRPDRIVIGCDADDEFAKLRMRRLYHPVTLQKERIHWMEPESAELTKYVANTMLAMRISFMNEVASLCEKVDADVHKVRKAVGADKRIGPKFLYAGPGYGGSCFPKDVAALVHTGHEHGLELQLARTTHQVNERQKGLLARKIKQLFDGDLRRRTIAVWGLSFKPNTDDIRNSPAITLIDTLRAEGAEVVAHDPAAMDNFRARYDGRVRLADEAYAALEGADALVLVTEWRQYQNPDFERVAELLDQPVVFDGRNIWSEYGLRSQGFTYVGIGVRGS